jgi:predicted HTH transcriptional regulator
VPTTVGTRTATIVFAVVAEEPYTTRRELQVALDLDAQIVKRALAYLAEQGEVVEATGESYAVADIIR